MDSTQLTSLLSGKSLHHQPTPIAPPASSKTLLPDLLGKVLGGAVPIPPPPPPTPIQTQIQTSRAQQTALPLFAQLVSQMMSELLEKPMTLMHVNRSRRAMIAQYLELLSEGAGGIPKKQIDENAWLQSWIEGPRTPAQNIALLTYFEELAIFYLAQASLLKAWSDRGIRRWKSDDLNSLSYTLNQILQSFQKPGNCERWNITTQNLFSWYNPSHSIQQDIWKKLEPIRLTEEGPQIMLDLISGIRRHQPSWPELKHYDSRFYSSLWDGVQTCGFNASESSTPIPRKKIAFSPTLRDGALVRSAPGELQWIGTEAHAFQFYSAEFTKLWWGPCAPYLWTTGTGLEVHSREQLSLSFSTSTTPASATTLMTPITAKIGEIEACDLSFVFEERAVRLNHKTGEALRFKEQLDELDYYKKIRGPNTGLGALQALIGLTKLRHGGSLWWIREEPLTKIEGDSLLSMILEKGKLVAEWDFSSVEHSLPSSLPLFPKYVYLIQRETSIDARHANRPIRITIRGQIRSHIEVPVLLQSAFGSIKTVPNHSHHWQIHRLESPIYQRDWIQKWPEPANHHALTQMEFLRTDSDPLASFATIQMPQLGRSATGATLPVPPVPSFVLKNAVWLKLIKNTDGCALSILPTLNHHAQERDSILVRFPDTSWIAPMKFYLESDMIKNWLEHHAEKKNDRWVLTEALLKYLPVSKWLVSALKEASPPDDLLQEQIQASPMKALEKIRASSQPTIARGQMYLLCARMLSESNEHLLTLGNMVGAQGKINWKQILNHAIPGAEMLPATLHPTVRMQGSLPSHIPIGRFERVKSPSPGILFLTETGHTLYLFCDRPRVLEMILGLLEGIQHATWSELTDYLRLPKAIELAESAANDILKSHGELIEQRKKLTLVMHECLQLSQN